MAPIKVARAPRRGGGPPVASRGHGGAPRTHAAGGSSSDSNPTDATWIAWRVQLRGVATRVVTPNDQVEAATGQLGERGSGGSGGGG